MAADKRIRKVVVVGGGTAGWLSAAILAAGLRRRGLDAVRLTVVESPSIATIGVGEGTWPSMRTTLQTIGLSETAFIRHCDAAFKQGTCFQDWCGQGGDRYLHPFTLPVNYQDRNPVQDWLACAPGARFSDAVSPQGRLAPLGCAPKTITTPEYAFYLNYGYHLNAARFAELLQRHCVEKLGVAHVLGDVQAVHGEAGKTITALALADGRVLEGDFFVDCSGLHGLLLAGFHDVPFIDCRDVLFNDSALAAQIPYADAQQQVASCTLSSAREAGWIWDIGLSNRRGVGYVYSGSHSGDERAEQVLREYLEQTQPGSGVDASVRKITFRPGYRARFWVGNCVAIGMSAGFIEPLEASALALVEMAAQKLVDNFPVEPSMLGAAGRRFNVRFRQHWETIIDFLKLHYVLSQREGRYWEDHRKAASIPASLEDRLTLWRYRPPWHQDALAADDLFPPASFQYILCGMGFSMNASPAQAGESVGKTARDSLAEVNRMTEKLGRTLPQHRDLLERIQRYGLPEI